MSESRLEHAERQLETARKALIRAEANVAYLRDATHWPIAELEIGGRAYNCLTQRAGLKTVAELVNQTPRELLRIKHLGRKTLVDIHEALARCGLSLRPGTEAWERKAFDEAIAKYGSHSGDDR